MSSITQNHFDENNLIDCVRRFFSRHHVGRLIARCNGMKEKGISLSKYVLENKLILKSKPKVKTETEPGNFNAYKYINNFQKNNYDRITVIIPKGIKKELVEKAKKSKKTLSRYVLENVIE